MRRRALSIAARAVEARLNADHSDHVGPFAKCSCGRPARYAGRRPKTFTSVLGLLRLMRAYYHCDPCESGYCPRDVDLGLDGGSLTPGVLRMVGAVGAMVSFAEGSQLLTELAGVDVSTKHVERAAEALGAEIAADELTDTEARDDATALPNTLYLGMDGTGIPMRAAELDGRAGKQADGSSRTREVKLVTVWSAEKTDDEGVPVRDHGSVTYSAAIESAASRDVDAMVSPFAARVDREADRRGFSKAKRQVVIGDGAAWIWRIASEQFPEATQIVDRFHVKQHISDVAKDIYGAGSERARSWADERNCELDDGKIDGIIAALLIHAGAEDEDNEARKCMGYLDRNRARMDYPQFRKNGLCTSSGVVEAGCKTAVGARTKRAGMHWTVNGANAIIALRCGRLSGRFEDFWERRADARKAA